MRFVLVSTHIDQTTGYSKVSQNLVKQLATLAPKVKTFHFGFQRHPARANTRKYPDGVSSYDAGANEDPKEEGFGFNKIHEYLEMVNPDVVMIYNDPLIVAKFIENMKHERGQSSYKLWVYIDQVYMGIAQQLMDQINKHADRIYCFSDIWKKQYLEYGSFPDVRVLEHALDPNVFTNMVPEASIAIRKNLSIPTDATVFLNMNRNSQRKRLDLSIAGFVRLLARRPQSKNYLLIATNLDPQTGAHYDVNRVYAEELKLAGLDMQSFVRNLLLVDTSGKNLLGDDTVNQLYNVCDIGINTSDGEGFGLCQLEHMYTGAPQIVTDVGSYRTFLDDTVAEFIPSDGRTYFAGAMPHGFYAPTFPAEYVADAMENTLNKLDGMKTAVSNYKFKSWATVCDGLLEDVLTEVGGLTSIVSVPVKS
jgi:glycosyltransferase involved in cell wall biosynthesis